jgi:predicted PurR-regulated permease PerM
MDAPTPDGLTIDQHVPGSRETWVRRAAIVWTAVGLIVVAIAVTLGFLRIADALAPFIVGGLISFLCRPLLRLFMGMRLPRGLAVAATFLVVVAVVGAALVLLVPQIAAQLEQLMRSLPVYWTQVQAFVSQIVARMKLLPGPARSMVDQTLNSMGENIRGAATAIAQFLFAAGGSALGFGFNVFLGFILSIWFLLDGPKIAKWVLWVIPPAWHDDAYQIGRAFDDSFGGYIRGTFINMTITFVACGIGFALVGLPYGWFVALAIGVLAVIPYLGPIVGGIIAAAIGFTVSPWMGIVTLVIVIVVEQTVDSVISPLVMGRSVSLHPVAILFALGIGGALAGFFGILLAIPVAAAIYTVYLYYRRKAPDAAELPDESNEPGPPANRPAEESA